MTTRAKPLTLRDGAMKATIWTNKSGNGDVFHSATFSKIYEDKDGKLRDGNSFTGTDLLKLSELAREAYAEINALRAEQKYESGVPSAPDFNNSSHNDQNNGPGM